MKIKEGLEAVGPNLASNLCLGKKFYKSFQLVGNVYYKSTKLLRKLLPHFREVCLLMLSFSFAKFRWAFHLLSRYKKSH